MRDSTTLTIGAFFDGRPGHEKQTRGILNRLQERTRTEVFDVQVERKPIMGQVLELLRYSASSLHQGDEQLSRCNFLIGAGTPTHLPMLAAKKRFAVPVITCMTPAPYLRGKFDLIFAPQHDGIAGGPAVIETIGPPTSNRNRGSHEENRVLLLCGGVDRRSHHWDSRITVGYLERIIQAGPHKRYILSSSPRTPVEMILMLISLADQYDNVEFHDYRNTPPGWIEEEYGRCSQVWVTADSISMVYEALSSGCMVGIIPVRWRRRNAKFARSQNYLLETGRVVEVENFFDNTHSWSDEPPLDEAGRCADELLRRFT